MPDIGHGRNAMIPSRIKKDNQNGVMKDLK